MPAVMKGDKRDQFPLLLRSLLDRGPRLQPDNLIITKTQDGYSTVTYAEHFQRSKRLGSALARRGVGVGDCVGTLLWNCDAHLQCYHAISCMGAILHTLNLRLGPKDLGYIIAHAADRVIIANHDLLKLLGDCDAAVLEAVELFVCFGEDGKPGAWQLPATIAPGKSVDYEAFLQSGDENFVWPDFPESTFHALCYTSGTTGQPKGAAYSHRSTYLHTLGAVAGKDQFGLSGYDTLLIIVPMFHVLSWGVPFGGLMLGTRCILPSRHMTPDALLGCILDHGATISNGVPTVWQGLRGTIEAKGLDKVRPNWHLKTLTCGGSAPPAALMGWFRDHLGCVFIQGWGMTETNPLGSLGLQVAKHKDLSKKPDQLFENIQKAGIPVPGVEVRIADQENLDKDVALGQPGELLVRGPWIIQQYFKVDAKDKFHNGWLITGDIAKLDDEGAVVICDRSKDVIKSGGEWISSIDMENDLMSLPGVAMSAVVAVAHPKWDERPVAVIARKPDVDSAEFEKGLLDRVQKHLSKNFAKFQLPDDVLVWDAIPLTSTGKIDKKVMRDRLQKENYVLPSLRSGASKL